MAKLKKINDEDVVPNVIARDKPIKKVTHKPVKAPAKTKKQKVDIKKPESVDSKFKKLGIKPAGTLPDGAVKHEGMLSSDQYHELRQHLDSAGYKTHKVPGEIAHVKDSGPNTPDHYITANPIHKKLANGYKSVDPKDITWHIKSTNRGVPTHASNNLLANFDVKNGTCNGIMFAATNKEEPRLNSKDHERVIQEAHDRHKMYLKAYHAHKDRMAPEVKKIAEKRGISQSQAARFHHGYPALKNLNHLRSTSQVEHEDAKRAYEDYKARKLLPKKEK